MTISVDWGTKVITIPQADLTPVGGTVYDLDTEAFRIDLRLAEQSELGIISEPTHNHNTSVLLGGISYARVIEMINGYTITFEETGTPYVVNLVGSNNNILDVTNLGTVQIRSNNSAGLINVKEIQRSAFQDRVWVDAVNGVNNTVYPSGTPSQPVATVELAKQIAVGRGFNSIFFMSSYTLADTDVLEKYMLTGISPSLTVLTLSHNATVGQCQMTNLSITGSVDDDCVITNCEVHDLTLFRGFIYNCSLHGTLGLSGNTEADIMSCYSGDASIPITVDMGTSGQSAAFRAWSGKIKITNLNDAAATVAIDMIGGEVEVDFTSVLAGTIAIQGNGEVKDYNNDKHLVHGYVGNVYIDNYAMSGKFQQEMWQLAGLDADNPLSVSNTSRTVSGISQTISDNGTTTTVTRT